MTKPCFFALLLVLTLAMPLSAQLAGDQLGIHDMTPTGNRGAPVVYGTISSACLYCHAPHGAGGGAAPLWNQQLSVQTYTTYTSTTYHQTGVQPPLASPSKLCLSCHDGSVAPGQTAAYGSILMSGPGMSAQSKFGTNLTSSHPFSLQTPLKDAPEMNVLLFATPPKTADPLEKVKLWNGSVECTSCHDPHYEGIDRVVPMFLVRDSSSGQLCLSCHDPDRIVTGQVNYLGGWAVSAHATSTSTAANTPYVGGYGTVAQNSCSACHMQHNASGPARLLRGPDQQDCIACHSGTTNTVATPNIFAEYGKAATHPFASVNNTHDRAESAVLNNNRHATCADCHNPHASQATTTFGAAPGIRPAQASVLGVSATDGITAVNPAVNQFEVCFRCHGTSQGKGSTTAAYGYRPFRAVAPADPLNIIDQFAVASTSSHPVTHAIQNALPQPSLRAQMLKLDGTVGAKMMTPMMFCTDCHNSDDNRESGGSGPNGPHGSAWLHVLERRYELSQAPGAGQLVSNMFPTPDLTISGPYALCAKCHDLDQIMLNTSFTEHARHIAGGFSCSVCHAPHGMGATSATISGERLVNFDLNVVAPNGTTAVSYNRATNTCSLVCHAHAH